MSITTPGGIRVTGAWTRAGLGSCVRVEGADKLDDIIFDCGVCEPECLKAGFVFISHGHVDHIGACVMHARAKMLTSKQSVYYVPTESVGPLDEARAAFSKMDGKDIPMNIVPIKPGDIVKVNSNLIVKVFQTIHRVPSQGYALYRRTNGGLLPEYAHLPGKEIGELRKMGVVVTSDTIETLELVYTGDTVFEGLIQPCAEFIFEAPILIMELTYLDGERQRAIDRGHIHLQDVVENCHKFNNQQIIFVHISERYGPHGKALMMLRDGLPSDLLSRSLVSLRSFGSGEHLTQIANIDWNKRRADVGWGWGRAVGNMSQQRRGKIQTAQNFNSSGVNRNNHGNRVVENSISNQSSNAINSSQSVRLNVTDICTKEYISGSCNNNNLESNAFAAITLTQEIDTNARNEGVPNESMRNSTVERGIGRGFGTYRGRSGRFSTRGGRNYSNGPRGRRGR